MKLDKLHLKNIAGVTAAMVILENHPATIKMEIVICDEMIEEIREDIISGTKTENEIDDLFDRLTKLIIKKNDLESLLRSIERSRDMAKRFNEMSSLEKAVEKLSKEES